MAATIVTTPSLGASDWSNFITQVAGLKKGFMQLSYTNFYSTAQSAIATGSVMEVNGSFYQFAETSIDYSTTTSANADLYIYAQPSAGGTTCTIVALTAACAWVDSKQGFYASAASNNRTIGGMYVGSAGKYYNKYIYDEDIVRICLQLNSTRPILTKIISIGEWNMDSTGSVTLDANIGTISKLRGIEPPLIRADTFDDWIPINFTDSSLSGTAISGISYGDSPDNIVLQRCLNMWFDSANYDATASTVANRGNVVISYEA